MSIIYTSMNENKSTIFDVSMKKSIDFYFFCLLTYFLFFIEENKGESDVKNWMLERNYIAWKYNPI